MGELIKKEDRPKGDHIIFFDKDMKQKQIIFNDYKYLYMCSKDQEYFALGVNIYTIKLALEEYHAKYAVTSEYLGKFPESPLVNPKEDQN